jgi:uncharacterized protein (TIGR02246 family)
MDVEDQREVIAIVQVYAEALNASDAERIVELFADDAVLMDLDRPTTVGRDRLAADYRRGLALGRVHRVFEVDQVLRSEDMATVRTHSSGILTIDGKASPSFEARELFVLKRGDTGWKIAQYMVQRLAAKG